MGTLKVSNIPSFRVNNFFKIKNPKYETLNNLSYLPGQTQLHLNPIGLYPNLSHVSLSLSLALLQNSCSSSFLNHYLFHLFSNYLLIMSICSENSLILINPKGFGSDL